MDKRFVCNLVFFVAVSKNFINAEVRLNNSTSLRNYREFEIVPGVYISFKKNELQLKFPIVDWFEENDVEERSSYRKKRPGIFSHIGSMMMMIPMAMQMLSLPVALASIKASLLRSLFVGKLALALIIYNAIRSSQNKDVVVIHQAQLQHHEHFYHHHEDEEDQGWFGR